MTLECEFSGLSVCHHVLETKWEYNFRVLPLLTQWLKVIGNYHPNIWSEELALLKNSILPQNKAVAIWNHVYSIRDYGAPWAGLGSKTQFQVRTNNNCPVPGLIRVVRTEGRAPRTAALSLCSGSSDRCTVQFSVSLSPSLSLSKHSGPAARLTA